MNPSRDVRIDVPEATVDGDLLIPDSAIGIVVFAHGSGSSRHSPRNQAVARHFHAVGLGTLLMDLLTSDEEAVDMRTSELRFDIPFLAQRLVGAVDWLAADADTAELRVGCFGASTGAAAALVAAAERTGRVAAVVSRGGRPDLARDVLPGVRAPTLLIVGGRDHQVLEMNTDAARRMSCDRRIEVIPGATHLFEERGALEEVARLAGDWFVRHLSAVGTRS